MEAPQPILPDGWTPPRCGWVSVGFFGYDRVQAPPPSSKILMAVGQSKVQAISHIRAKFYKRKSRSPSAVVCWLVPTLSLRFGSQFTAHGSDMAAADANGREEPLPYYGEDQEPAPPSSRLCVKNIPKHLKDDRLREHFAERGEVTDVKILKTGCVRRAPLPRRRATRIHRPTPARRVISPSLSDVAHPPAPHPAMFHPKRTRAPPRTTPRLTPPPPPTHTSLQPTQGRQVAPDGLRRVQDDRGRGQGAGVLPQHLHRHEQGAGGVRQGGQIRAAPDGRGANTAPDHPRIAGRTRLRRNARRASSRRPTPSASSASASSRR